MTKITYDIMLFMFRSKIDLLCLEERGMYCKQDETCPIERIVKCSFLI